MIRNFLILDESAAGERSLSLASAFTPLGYVYCAFPGCPEVHDTTEGVRCLPLTGGSLPALGDLELAIVVGTPSLANRVRQTYPQSAVISLTHRVP